MIFLILMGFTLTIFNVSPNDAYGLWVPQSPEELLEQSETVFVGTITSVNVLEFERSNTYNVEENGVPRIVVENYTQSIDEYTVNIEEFIKNPQESHTITMLEATVGGVPGRSVAIGGFDLNDRVLFFVPRIDDEQNQYSPESFKIPKQCDAKSVLEQPRIQMGNSFNILQDGIEKEGSLVAGKPIQFVYQRDMRSLDEENFDFQITVRKETNANRYNDAVLSEKIHAKSNPCEWIAVAKAEFTPQAGGEYSMWINITEGTGTDTFSRSFSVEGDTPEKNLTLPLKQFRYGISLDGIQCNNNLLLIQKYDGSPACVTLETKTKLTERGWTLDSKKQYISEEQDVNISTDPVLAEKITESSNQFALDFYKQESENKNENIFFSSPSISTAFSILYEGARGDTADEMHKVFGFPKDDDERRVGFFSFGNTIDQKNDNENTIQMANALWLANEFAPLSEYVNTAKTYYSSSADSVNFASDEGRLEINDWVKSQTQDRIEELLKPGSTNSLTKMVITNAIYFNGVWEHPFDTEDTYEADFVVDSDKTVKVSMMSYPHKMNLNYTSTEQMQLLQMPYKENTFSMLIILPNDADDMQSVEQSLTLENLKLWKNKFYERETIIHIPKFTIETEYDLKESLTEMGMPSVFGPADLSGITGSKGLFVSEAVHKAFVDVNEKGTEAAAATAISVDESSGQLFKANRPFIFIIQDNETESILFLGRIMDPTK